MGPKPTKDLPKMVMVIIILVYKETMELWTQICVLFKCVRESQGG